MRNIPAPRKLSLTNLSENQANATTKGNRTICDEGAQVEDLTPVAAVVADERLDAMAPARSRAANGARHAPTRSK
jgi:hypothetical protein